MKNNKGFTLVEILAVLVVLAAVMIIAIPSIGGAFSSSKGKIDDLTKRNIQESAKMFANELYICDSTSINIWESYGDTCTEVRIRLADGIDISIDNLVEGEYFSDPANKCTGDLNIQTDSKGKVTVTLNENVTCDK